MCADPSPALSSTRWACLELPISLGQLACNLIPLGGQSLQPAASRGRPLCADNEEYSAVSGARSRETSSAYCGRTMLLIRTRRHGRHRRHAPGHAEFKRRCSRNGRAPRFTGRHLRFVCVLPKLGQLCHQRAHLNQTARPGRLALRAALFFGASKPGDGASGCHGRSRRCPAHSFALAATTSGACAPATDSRILIAFMGSQKQGT